jgi:TolC family type I secretion outer membrane protein
MALGQVSNQPANSSAALAGWETCPTANGATRTSESEDAQALTLGNAIRIARESNPDIRSAGERIQIADAALVRARAQFYPQLGVAENYGVSDNPVNAFTFLLNQGRLSLAQNLTNPDTTDNFHTQVFVQQDLYTGGRRTAQTQSAQALRDAATSSLEVIQNELVFRVAEAYYRLLQARDLVKVRSEAVEQVERHLGVVQARFRAGTAVKSDVLTVEVRLAEVREGLITANNQLELAWAVLENVVGRHVEQRALPEGIPVAPWSDRMDEVESAVAEATHRSPAMGELASRRHSAEHDVRAARAGKYPTVGLVSDYDVHSGDLASGQDSFFVGLAVRLIVFDGGRTESEVRQACARLSELEARQQRLILDIELDVRRSYLQVQDAEERFNVSAQAVAQAEESLREIEVRYRGQTATITQLIDAQVALSNARVRRANAQAELEIARASLERAVGRLTNFLSR